jgi:hypothetical protein
MPTKEQLEQALHDLGVPWSWDEYMAHSAQTKASSAEWFEKEMKPMLREHAEQMLLKLVARTTAYIRVLSTMPA